MEQTAYYLSKKYLDIFSKKMVMDVTINKNGIDIATFKTNYLNIKDFKIRENLKSNVKIIRI